ncbi:hypothetical protein FOZ63_024116, partial [Perkinsus olseni]
EVKKGVVEAMLNWREVLVEEGVVWEAERVPIRGYFQLDFADSTVATGKMICKILRSLKALRLARLSAGGKMAAAAKLKTAGVDVEIGRGEVPEEDFLLGA